MVSTSEMLPLTSRICVSWPTGSAKTCSKWNCSFESDNILEPTDLNYSSRAYIPNIVWLKGYFDGLIKNP